MYRLDFRGTELFVVSIDGLVLDSGIPNGPFPSASSGILWSARYYLSDQTTRWDYIRYGRTPPLMMPADTNCDAAINFFDIDPFVLALDRSGWLRGGVAGLRHSERRHERGSVGELLRY